MGSTVLVTIGVLTFHRPEHIRETVRAIHDQVMQLDPSAFDAEVLVVDNDPGGSGRIGVEQAIAEHGLTRIRYVIEPTPGIAAGRNRVLDEAGDRDLVLFLDDDGRPAQHWLHRMLTAWASTKPAAVAGWVDTHYEGPHDPWIRAGGFFDRRRWEDGRSLPAAACGNLLLDLRQLGAQRFARDLGLSGGEDTLLTRQLVARGGRIVFCREAVVVDLVAAERLNRSWVLLRSLSHGNTSGVLDMYLATSRLARARTAAGGLARFGAGVAKSAGGYLSRTPQRQAKGARTAARGLGMTLAAAGLSYDEYARSASGWRRVVRAPRSLAPGAFRSSGEFERLGRVQPRTSMAAGATDGSVPNGSVPNGSVPNGSVPKDGENR